MRLHDLIAHKGYADAALLHAVRQHPAASSDTELRSLLHHVLISNRFWLLSIVGEPFVAEAATRAPAPLDAMIADFRTIHDRETAWLADATDRALSRTLENALIPGGRCTILGRPAAGVPALTGPPRTVREDAAGAGRQSAGDRFHPLAGGSTRTRVASS